MKIDCCLDAARLMRLEWGASSARYDVEVVVEDKFTNEDAVTFYCLSFMVALLVFTYMY